MSDSTIKTYVWHNGKCFFVSTIDRDSSATLGPRMHAETIVWNFDWNTNQRGEQIYMDEAAAGSIRTHQRIVEFLHANGTLETDKNE